MSNPVSEDRHRGHFRLEVGSCLRSGSSSYSWLCSSGGPAVDVAHCQAAIFFSMPRSFWIARTSARIPSISFPPQVRVERLKRFEAVVDALDVFLEFLTK